MSPHAVRGAGTSQTVRQWKEGGKRGGRVTAWAKSCYNQKPQKTPPVYLPSSNPQAHGIPACTCVWTMMTTRET